MEEVSIGIQSIAENASDISESAVYSRQQAETGADYVRKTVQQMTNIHESVLDTDSRIKSLDEKSREISGILEIIRQISAQTNLLSLNAAIEASKAGEHGRGFAVVATEVKKLAEQSGKSSDRIGDLINEIEVDMKRSIEAIVQVKKEVQTGLKLTEETDRNFVEIVRSNGRIAEQIEMLASTAEEMSASAQEITASVTEIAEIARETSSNSHQATASTKEQLASIEQITDSTASLSKVSDELQMALAKFKI
jgi:methyl-accepting chemotaxis protein